MSSPNQHRELSADELLQYRHGSGTRKNNRKAQKSRGKGVIRGIIGVFGELLITLGVLLILFVAWELWWTNIIADSKHSEELQTLSQEWGQPTEPIAPPEQGFGDPVIGAKPSYEGEVFGKIYIPRFNQDFVKPLAEGVSDTVLDTLGVGRYPTSAMIGDVGNASVAGHRDTNGQVFDNMHEMRPGDDIIIETKEGWYTYKYRSSQVVLPSQAEVLNPVPSQENVQPTDRILTLTTCNPRLSSTERLITWAVLDSWQPREAGAPAEIAHIAA